MSVIGPGMQTPGSRLMAGQETYEELHLRNLLIHLLHELNNEIHQLMLQHLLGMEIGDQE